jgi:ferredoxin
MSASDPATTAPIDDEPRTPADAADLGAPEAAPLATTEVEDEPGVRVRVHPALCNGWGQCHRWAPNVYWLDEEGYIETRLMEVPPEHALEAWHGAQSCPEGAITVIGPPEPYWRERRRRLAEEG